MASELHPRDGLGFAIRIGVVVIDRPPTRSASPWRATRRHQYNSLFSSSLPDSLSIFIIKMKFSNVLPFVAAGSAFVLPSEEVLQDISIESNHRGNGWKEEALSTKDDVLSSFKKHYDEVTETSKDVWNDVAEQSKNALDTAFAKAGDFSEKIQHSAFDAESWLELELQSFDEEVLDDPHHGPPHDGPHHPPHDGPPHGGPHHPPHHGPPNHTVYELISHSKYTTKFAKLINDYPDLVEKLNSTKANYVCGSIFQYSYL